MGVPIIMDKKPKIIAFYLPQFHPIPENDEWWGKGFTEWTNVGKARPLFPGHYQPRIPADLGYYDLRVPETREAQAQMAREAGIEGFCYWHYWFGNGKRLLERPFNEVLESGKPDFPFCLAWANESWKGIHHGLSNRKVLIEQLYPGIDDYTKHFYTVLPAFMDTRYITVDDKPLFMIYKPLADTEVATFIKTWRELAKKNGLSGIYFVGQCMDRDKIELYKKIDIDAINIVNHGEFLKHRNLILRILYRIYRIITRSPYIVSYKKAMRYFFDKNIDSRDNIIPAIISGWDHTPRSGRYGIILNNYTPYLFQSHAQEVILNCSKTPNIIFLKSWNEWAEGNYLEPDLRWGKQYIEVLAKLIKG
ncbi:glycosyl transferase [Spirochaetia bacterium]|nr:glycosyl transferase [Spirochaetia bacterium]